MEKFNGFSKRFYSVEEMIGKVNENTKYYSTDGKTFNILDNGRFFRVVILDNIETAPKIETCVFCRKKILSKPYETIHGLLCRVCAYENFYIGKDEEY